MIKSIVKVMSSTQWHHDSVGHHTISLTNAFVISLKTSSALIGGNCTTWPCNNFACYTVAWYTFRMLHSYLVYISNVTHLH